VLKNNYEIMNTKYMEVKMKILFVDQNSQYLKERLKELKLKFPNHEFIEISKTDENFINELKTADGIVNGYLEEKYINLCKNLKIVFVPFAGVNNLDLKPLFERNIMISNSHGNGKHVAERAFSLALTLIGKIHNYHDDLKVGKWHGFTVYESAKKTWTSMYEKKCGILGLGSIGLNLAKLLKVFDCEIIGYKRNLDVLPENIDKISNELEEVFENSDIVFVCLPLTDKTEGIIDKKYLNEMKNKFLINVGRGPIIKEKDLYEALESKSLKGFAGDVWYNYPTNEKKFILPSNYPLHLLENVLLSPHVAGYNLEAVEGSIDGAFENIISFLEKGKPIHSVNKNEKY
jgi:phosphoglycerate dehydrogenase-like enzyme